jgi:DNA-binding CsgD family transcriptional regulator
MSNDGIAAELILTAVQTSEVSHQFIEEFRQRLIASGIALSDGSEIHPTTQLIQDRDQKEFLELWKLLRSHVAARAARYASVSLREEELLACLLLHFRDKDIGSTFGISTAAVKSSVHCLLGKFGVPSRHELVRKLLEE